MDNSDQDTPNQSVPQSGEIPSPVSTGVDAVLPPAQNDVVASETSRPTQTPPVQVPAYKSSEQPEIPIIPEESLDPVAGEEPPPPPPVDQSTVAQSVPPGGGKKPIVMIFLIILLASVAFLIFMAIQKGLFLSKGTGSSVVPTATDVQEPLEKIPSVTSEPKTIDEVVDETSLDMENTLNEIDNALEGMENDLKEEGVVPTI